MGLLNKYRANTWVVKDPVLLYRVLRGFYRAFMQKKNTLKTVELFPSFACPLSCPMCSVEKYKGKTGRTLEIGDYEWLADDLAKMGAIAVNILGGEPMAYPHLPELISILSRRHFYVDIVSNGLLSNRDYLQELKQAGLNMVLFSLDSLEPAVNDHIRGEGHYQSVLKNIEDARSVGLKTGFSCVLFHQRLSHGEELIKYCHQHGLTVTGSQVAAVGNAELSDLLDEEEQAKVRDMVKRYPHLLFDWSLSYFFSQRCPGGKEKIGITCFGDVIICSVNPLCFGNVLEEPISKIWERMGSFSQISRDVPLCRAAEDHDYIKRYLEPAHQSSTYPVYYHSHPLMTPEQEPKLYTANE